MVSLQRTDFSAMLVSLFSRLLCGSTGDDEQSVVSTPREITFPYETFRGSGASHFVRLRLPEESEGCCALVVNIHGGFWKEYWNLSQTLDTSALLAASCLRRPPSLGRRRMQLAQRSERFNVGVGLATDRVSVLCRKPADHAHSPLS